jgi:serine/threonine-protein kinase
MKHPTPDDLLLRFQEAVRGRYAVDSELGRGAMGVVFLARDLRLDRAVAIKVLAPALDAPADRERFLREARLAARLSHPHVVPIHAVEEHGPFVCFVMTYVDGGTLAERIARSGPLPAEEAGRLLREVAWALAYAHAQGIVHRDIKPDNILLEHGTQRALVTDFGIARPEQDELGGTRLGTPGFASPEQATGDAADARSDIYGLGALGFCLLAGRPPFDGDARAIVTRQLEAPAPRVREVAPGTPRDLAAVVDRCLSRNPADRYQTADELASAIGRALPAPRELPPVLRTWVMGRPQIFNAMALGTIGGATWFTIFMLFGGIPMMRAGQWTLFWSVFSDFMRLSAIGFTSWGLLFVSRVLEVRKLVARGVTVPQMRAALRLRNEQYEEELSVSPEPPTWARVVRWLAIAHVVLAVSVVVIQNNAPFVFADLATSTMQAFELYLQVTIPTLGAVTIFFPGKRVRPQPFLWKQRVQWWLGRTGEWMAKLAAWRLPKSEVTGRTANLPTELALEDATLAIFAALPADQQRALADLKPTVERLARYAERERKAVQASPGAATRLAEAIDALETLRLGLLRLRAGSATLQGVTTDLRSAHDLSRTVNRLADAQLDVERLLRPNTG